MLNNIEIWRKKVLVTAITDAIWEKHLMDFPKMKEVLEKLISKDYKNVYYLNEVIEVLCAEKYIGKGQEAKMRSAARKLIAAEILKSKISILKVNESRLKQICR